MTNPRFIRLAPEDNVVVAVDQIAPGATLAGTTARERVPRGHKMAVAAIQPDEPVRKYGQIIGFAAKAIAPGDWVHEHNVALHDFARDYRFAEGARNDEVLPPEQRATFEGYLRPNGKTGTRNYIGVLTSVNCSATVAKFIAEEVNRSGLLADYPGIDGVVAFVHGTGCGMASRGEPWDVLRRTQWGYATHPNLGGTLMVGLGCEVFQIDRMKDEYGLVEGEHFQSMTIQATGGTKKTVAEGVERIKAMLPVAARAQPRDAPRFRDRAGAAMRRLRRLLRHHRQSGARFGGRSPGQARRHRRAGGDAGNLRRRAFAHPPRGEHEGRRETGRAHSLVGGLHRAQSRRDEQQSFARATKPAD